MGAQEQAAWGRLSSAALRSWKGWLGMRSIGPKDLRLCIWAGACFSCNEDCLAWNERTPLSLTGQVEARSSWR